LESRPASLPFTVLLGVLFALTALGTDAWPAHASLPLTCHPLAGIA
jgi:hypothetical protein